MIHGVLYAVYILFFLFVKLSLSCGRVVDQHVLQIVRNFKILRFCVSYSYGILISYHFQYTKRAVLLMNETTMCWSWNSKIMKFVKLLSASVVVEILILHHLL